MTCPGKERRDTMKKKIDQFLLAMLILTALLLLVIPGHGAPAQTIAGETTAPSEPTIPSEETQPPADALDRVQQILDAAQLSETAAAHCVYDKDLLDDFDVDGRGEGAAAHALARLCEEQEMNPISAFWLLAEEGLYEKTQDLTGAMPVAAISHGEQEAKEYAYSEKGVRTLLTDLLKLSGTFDDGLPMEDKLLGWDRKVENGQIFREGEECYYAYFVVYGEGSAHFLCFYLRGEETIGDVEFQLLNLRYARGEEEVLDQLDQSFDRQTAGLMTAAELLLTGQSRAAEGSIPFAYDQGDCAASIERFDLTASGESGTLTNYRLQVR